MAHASQTVEPSHLPGIASDSSEARLPATNSAEIARREAERESLDADRAEIERLKAETRELHHEATRNRDRTRRLADRYGRLIQQKMAGVREELEARKRSLSEAEQQQANESARFQAMREEFQAAASDARNRIRLAWEEFESHRQRSGEEWKDTSESIAKQEAIFAGRAADLKRREEAVAGLKAKIESETAGLRQETAALEARASHARSVVEELEKRRDDLQAELLAAPPVRTTTPQQDAFCVPLDRAADRDLKKWSDDLDAQDRWLAEERDNLSRLKASFDRQAIRLADERKVLAEQFALLSAARAEWQEAESRTMAEIEELAQGLRARDEMMLVREERVNKAESRRREETETLQQLRAQLEAWQSKLTSTARIWHEQREKSDRQLAQREQKVAAQDALLQESLARCERMMEVEVERVRGEVRLWSEDRGTWMKAADEYNRRSKESLGELATLAARASASEDLLSESVEQGPGTTRRFAILLKRWERVFSLKLREVEEQRAEAAAERARADERYSGLQTALGELVEREREWLGKASRLEAEFVEATQAAARAAETPHPQDHSAAEEELPWATEEAETEGHGESEPRVLPFTFHSRAA